MDKEAIEDASQPATEAGSYSMTPGQRRFAVALGLAMVLLVVGGGYYLFQSGAFRDRPQFDRRWEYCESGDRCIAVRAPCESWVSINEKHLDDARAYYGHMISVIENSSELACQSRPHGDRPPIGYCLSGLCAFLR